MRVGRLGWGSGIKGQVVLPKASSLSRAEDNGCAIIGAGEVLRRANEREVASGNFPPMKVRQLGRRGGVEIQVVFPKVAVLNHAEDNGCAIAGAGEVLRRANGREDAGGNLPPMKVRQLGRRGGVEIQIVFPKVAVR